MKKVKVLGIVGSSRNRGNANKLLALIKKCSVYQDLYNIIYGISSAKKISNSEAIIMAALFGAKAEGAEIDLFTLSDYFQKVETLRGSELIMEKLQEADGIVVSSPVYFGDRSSYVNSLFNILRSREKLPLSDKIVGFISVGAKRNGGQETTNVYGLYDSLQLGASVVGNGPPTSQFGGTAWAGDIGSIIDDNFGLQTSLGTGKRVAEVAKVMNHASAKKSETQNIIVIMANQDPKSTIKRFLDEAFEDCSVDIDIKVLHKYKLFRCIGCSICPEETEDYYKCILKDDDMKELHASVRNADGILFAANFRKKQSIDLYQIFIERMRFIRRNNFELTNMPVSSFHVEEPGINSIFQIRVLTSMVRHNTIFVGPQYMGMTHTHGIIHNQLLKKFGKDFTLKTSIINMAKNNMTRKSALYIPIGYSKNR